ncbi:MAG: c-type cytochrome [Chloroflexota bacterium]
MDEKEQKQYLEKYKLAKEKGINFFPDAIFKDSVVSLVVFIILVALAYFVGAPLEEQANPSDTSYTPRPEWYFLFLFQLLKYFPGELEVIGVVVLPTLAIIFLLLLPFIDKSTLRHFVNRKWVALATLAGLGAVVGLSVLSVLEAPPPSGATLGDQTALLYTEDCAGCHGPTINVPQGTNLHEVIATGNHEGMPPWSADLTNDQIDSLVGFILSPAGSNLFTNYCSACHEATQLVGVNPLEMKRSLVEGLAFPPHAEADIPHWVDILSVEERTSLLNFLIAPDGQRLFSSNCSACHGYSVSFSGGEEELRKTIIAGGLHLEMPGWQERLSEANLDLLARYVQDPGQTPQGADLYQTNCVDCHFDRIPKSDSYEQALEVIATGGTHKTMPVWGEILTEAQFEALVTFTIGSARGVGQDLGRRLFVESCTSCHGDFGEGGPNPSLAGDIIAPISTAEYLKTRDDLTLALIIEQGQPNFGMSPFGLSYGGPLDSIEVNALVGYIRSWQAAPPVELPPEVEYSAVILSGSEIYQSICAQCHGFNATGEIGPSLRSRTFLRGNTSEEIFDSISNGHEVTSMIAWGEILSSKQVQELVNFILSLPEVEEGEIPAGGSFAVSVLPIFNSYCALCHDAESADGGWISTSYLNVMHSGDNGPAVIPGDIDISLLVLKILGLHTDGDIMPPRRVLPEDLIQIILDWIAAGAQNN